MPFSQIILDAWGWCTGTTQRDDMGREEGGGFSLDSWPLHARSAVTQATAPDLASEPQSWIVSSLLTISIWP